MSMVSGLEGHDYVDRLKELGLDTFEEKRLQIDMTQVYKVLNGKDKVSSDTRFFSVAANESGHGPSKPEGAPAAAGGA